eukprot:TRINITY_DN1074_c0_g1_i2.p1 TRINITY_DN1074_c0_g1~~TRINITY_DN1074_c0_g1_i2.p1  ORF type:complete len:374 (-),score=80.11 TRINITY_DN1074_c0_g1_i2:22-1143(-)
MKACLFILAGLVLSVSCTYLRPSPLKAQDLNQEVIDILSGLLEGFQLDGAHVDLILTCVKNEPGVVKDVQNVVKDIEKAIEAFKDITDIKNIEKLVAGLLDIMKVVETMLKALEPCVQDYEEIVELIEKFKSLTLEEWSQTLVNDLFFHGAEIYTELMKAIDDVKKQPKDWHDFGVNLGEIIWMLVFGKNKVAHLSAAVQVKEDYAMDTAYFIEGFLEGIEADGEDIHEVVECFKEAPIIIPDIEDILVQLKHISWTDVHKIYKIFTDLFDCISKVFHGLEPCTHMSPELKNVYDEFKGLTLTKWLKVLKDDLKDGYGIFKKLIAAYDAFRDGTGSKKWEEIGKNLGYITWEVIFGKKQIYQLSFSYLNFYLC